MSLPQIDEAFILTRTCPWPGSGIGYSLNSTVLFPGRITPGMVWLAVAVLMGWSIRQDSRRGDLATHIPEVFPGLALFPEEHLALDQPAVLVDRRDLAHVLVGERLADDRLQAGQELRPLDGEGDRHLPTPHGPHDAYDPGMHSQSLGDPDDHRIL